MTIELKEHVEVVLREKDRAIEMATEEREKAAAALRKEMERAVQEGDDRLREHISNQIMQIKAALDSAEKLEVNRVEGLQKGIDGLGREQEILRQAQILAQGKFERSVEGRFAQVNEFRGSLDDLSKQMATRRELETTQTAQAQAMSEMQKQIVSLGSRLDVGPAGLGALQSRVDVGSGRQEGVKLTTGMLFSGLAALAAIITIVVIVANVLAR